MDNFKFNFLSRGQLESLSLAKFFLTVFIILPYHEVFFGNLIFAIIARMFGGNHVLNISVTDTFIVRQEMFTDSNFCQFCGFPRFANKLSAESYSTGEISHEESRWCLY